jgi:hypothetical protein
MYASDNIIRWEVDELSIAESQNIDNTGKLIIHFANNKLLNLELIEYYPNVKKIFFQYKEGEVLLNIENIDLTKLENNRPVYIERIVSFMLIKGFLKIILDTILSFFKSGRFQAIRSKADNANGYYSALRLTEYYKIEIDKYSQDRIVCELGDCFDYEDLHKQEKTENIIEMINNNIKYREIWKEKGFDWGGIISKKSNQK